MSQRYLKSIDLHALSSDFREQYYAPSAHDVGDIVGRRKPTTPPPMFAHMICRLAIRAREIVVPEILQLGKRARKLLDWKKEVDVLWCDISTVTKT